MYLFKPALAFCIAFSHATPPPDISLQVLNEGHQGQDVYPFLHNWANFQPRPTAAPPHPQPSESFYTHQVGDHESSCKEGHLFSWPFGAPLSSPVPRALGCFVCSGRLEAEVTQVSPWHPPYSFPRGARLRKWSQEARAIGPASQEALSRQKPDSLWCPRWAWQSVPWHVELGRGGM